MDTAWEVQGKASKDNLSYLTSQVEIQSKEIEGINQKRKMLQMNFGQQIDLLEQKTSLVMKKNGFLDEECDKLN